MTSSPIAAPPQQFSSTDGTITGAIDGVNAVFLLGVVLRRTSVWKNGLLMTLNTDCAAGGRSIVFLAGRIPQAGDVITVEGYAA